MGFGGLSWAKGFGFFWGVRVFIGGGLNSRRDSQNPSKEAWVLGFRDLEI